MNRVLADLEYVTPQHQNLTQEIQVQNDDGGWWILSTTNARHNSLGTIDNDNQLLVENTCTNTAGVGP